RLAASLPPTCYRYVIPPPPFPLPVSAPSASHPLSLHDALPIFRPPAENATARASIGSWTLFAWWLLPPEMKIPSMTRSTPARSRSEEHTSELQSHLNLVCRLLLEKKSMPQSEYESTNITRSRTP